VTTYALTGATGQLGAITIGLLAEHVAAEAGLPDFVARMFADSSFQMSKDVLYDTSGDLAWLIGRPTEPIAGAIARALA
jgi:hypothetical protein